MIGHFLNPPNWFTAASLFCSVYALALVLGAPEITSDVLSQACVLVIFGGIFDLLDGRVARLTNRFSDFGVQLDSIADIVGFGVAPALVAWAWVLKDLGLIGVIATFWFVLCAAFRLARFNVDATDRAWPLSGHGQGLTTTMAGGSLVTLVWVANGYGAAWVIPAWTVAALMMGLGWLMVSSVPFRNFKDLRNNPRARTLLALGLAACLLGGVVLDPSMWWGVGGALYLTLGLVDGIVTAIWHRRLSKALLIDELYEAMGMDDEDEPSSVEVEA
ncbi:MAG: CDP-diacylglycerol--serine O-phosphatidyltransferase [Myxococcales bacterium]|nr:CDP-diacylglycerol--serine O-phosphatidyltransferase [Myxococcales bacterium]